MRITVVRMTVFRAVLFAWRFRRMGGFRANYQIARDIQNLRRRGIAARRIPVTEQGENQP